MPLYLLRHGETEFNVLGRFQGQNDSPLTELGFSQAQNNGRKLSEIITDKARLRIVCSPLSRAYKTSLIIGNSLGVENHHIQTDDRLLEINLGAWQGMTKREIKQQYRQEWSKRRQDPMDYQIEGGGESYRAVISRVDDWLAQTCEKWEGNESWVVVSHGVTGCIIRGQYLSLDIHETRALSRNHDWFYEIRQGKVITHK